MSIGESVVVLVGVAATALVAALYFYQTELIYPARFPPGSRQSVMKPHEFGMAHYEDLTLMSPDGLRLKAYLIKQPEGMHKQTDTIIYLHVSIAL